MAAFIETLLKYLFYITGREFGFWNVIILLGIIFGLIWLVRLYLSHQQTEVESETENKTQAEQKARQQAEYERRKQRNAKQKAQEQKAQEQQREKQVNFKMGLREAYSVLGLKEEATKEQIKMAYRKNVKQCHPDLFVEHEFKEIAEEEFKRINDAYHILSHYKK